MNKEEEIKEEFYKTVKTAKDLFYAKTEVYGIDFFKNNSLEDWNDGFYGGLKRKWMRFETFKKKGNVGLETIEDTLMDMGIYCFMLAVAFKKNYSYDEQSPKTLVK